MKFIDLYNSAAKTEIFKLKRKNYKIYCYLAKIYPDRYSAIWDGGIFKVYEQYIEWSSTEIGPRSSKRWKEIYNSKEFPYTTMSDFNRKNF